VARRGTLRRERRGEERTSSVERKVSNDLRAVEMCWEVAEGRWAREVFIRGIRLDNKGMRMKDVHRGGRLL